MEAPRFRFYKVGETECPFGEGTNERIFWKWERHYWRLDKTIHAGRMPELLENIWARRVRGAYLDTLADEPEADRAFVLWASASWSRVNSCDPSLERAYFALGRRG